jgi:hypothetical protein
MTQTHKKAIVISPFWASAILTALLTVAVPVWTAYADYALVKKDVDDMKTAKLPDEINQIKVRLASLEQKATAGAEAGIRIERKQDKMDDKIDQLLLKK